MEYYESYFDEDLDEELSEGYDEASEGYDESGDLSENRASQKRRQQERQDRRSRRREGRQERRRGGGKSDGKPASTGAVKAAFADAKVEVANVKDEVKKAEVRKDYEQMNHIIGSILFRPKLETGKMAILTASAEDPITKKRTYTVDATKALVFVDDNNNPILGADGNPIPAVVGTKLVDNLLALMAVKFIGNMKGVDTSKGFQQYLPLLAGVALSPSVQKDLGLGGLLGTGSGTSSDNGGLSNLTKNPAVLLLLLLFFMKK